MDSTGCEESFEGIICLGDRILTPFVVALIPCVLLFGHGKETASLPGTAAMIAATVLAI